MRDAEALSDCDADFLRALSNRTPEKLKENPDRRRIVLSIAAIFGP